LAIVAPGGVGRRSPDLAADQVLGCGTAASPSDGAKLLLSGPGADEPRALFMGP